MNGECVRIEHMADIELLPPDDPRRRHLETCPRCRAAYAAYRDFMTPPPDLDTKDARARLEAALEREMAVPASKVAGSIAPRRSARWVGWTAAAAALVVVAGVLWMRPQAMRPQDAPVLRGPTARTTLALASPVVTPEGVTLSWTAEPAATAYEVEFYDDAMREVLRVPAGSATRLVLTRAMLGERAAIGTDLAWRVIAIDAAGEMGRSAIGTFAAP
jgi:hypothetical protein